MNIFITSRLFITYFIALFCNPIVVFSQVLTNTKSISISKTWSQQPSGFKVWLIFQITRMKLT